MTNGLNESVYLIHSQLRLHTNDFKYYFYKNHVWDGTQSDRFKSNHQSIRFKRVEKCFGR